MGVLGESWPLRGRDATRIRLQPCYSAGSGVTPPAVEPGRQTCPCAVTQAAPAPASYRSAPLPELRHLLPTCGPEANPRSAWTTLQGLAKAVMPPVVSHLQFHQRGLPDERLPRFFSDGWFFRWLTACYEQGRDSRRGPAPPHPLPCKRKPSAAVPAMWSSVPLDRLRSLPRGHRLQMRCRLSSGHPRQLDGWPSPSREPGPARCGPGDQLGRPGRTGMPRPAKSAPVIKPPSINIIAFNPAGGSQPTLKATRAK